ncbi:MAG: type I-E CRISPR-associated protein Cse2/CasB [Candidatus Accumulibacter necessarius]|jgi:CRISPR system Cascade subunit CasB|uniref:type I-E CRISPR-associated protein Cse2/CasB n=1 Tax=Candidatus Accumulibacter necessarius TaxID=2954386 RepID=UPI002FC2E761
MSEHAQSFITHLIGLKDRERGAFAHLKRSLGFDPGAYPPAYPYVERFVGADKHADDPRRQALYLTAGLFAFHPMHHEGASFAAALGRLGRSRESESIEKRFVALLGAEPESLPTLLRQSVSLLAADGIGCDYVSLLDDLARWFDHWNLEARDRLRQHWARDFYRAYDPHTASADDLDAALLATEPAIEL